MSRQTRLDTFNFRTILNPSIETSLDAARKSAYATSRPGEFSHPHVATESAHGESQFVRCHGKAHCTDVLTNFRNRLARSVKMENGKGAAYRAL